MEEIRGAALAYHKKSSKGEKEIAEALFKELDVEENGKIKFIHFHSKLKEKKYVEHLNKSSELFKKLLKKNVDFLDKEDIITLSFIIKSGRLLFCDSCSKFLPAQYFLCLQCYESSTNGSFYKLCSSCYHSSNFIHDEGAEFIDIDSLAKRLREGCHEAEKSGGKSNKKKKNFKRWTYYLLKFTLVATSCVLSIFHHHLGVICAISGIHLLQKFLLLGEVYQRRKIKQQ